MSGTDLEARRIVADSIGAVASKIVQELLDGMIVEISIDDIPTLIGSEMRKRLAQRLAPAT